VCHSTSPLIKLEDGSHLSLLDFNKINDKISDLRKSVRRIIVCIHWGIEESSYSSKENILMARSLIEGGVDIVIGTHAHAPQSVERYKGGIIAYNLGNFIMNNIPSYFDEKGIPHSTYYKRLMIWNRISWGLLINMETMEYRIKKYMFLSDRIIRLYLTPLDKYIKLSKDSFNGKYEHIISRHLKKRRQIRKIFDFIYNPHIPQKVKRLL
jgi:hypothetical protein